MVLTLVELIVDWFDKKLVIRNTHSLKHGNKTQLQHQQIGAMKDAEQARVL